tara:strand:- start:295 stop:423 length:129 start_codon:yes stop_codon:yes gene_type:complete
MFGILGGKVLDVAGDQIKQGATDAIIDYGLKSIGINIGTKKK